MIWIRNIGFSSRRVQKGVCWVTLFAAPILVVILTTLLYSQINSGRLKVTVVSGAYVALMAATWLSTVCGFCIRHDKMGCIRFWKWCDDDGESFKFLTIITSVIAAMVGVLSIIGKFCGSL